MTGDLKGRIYRMRQDQSFPQEAMSKRVYQTITTKDVDREKAVARGTPVVVESGWDPPLERLFLNVERLDRVDGRDVETVFTNLERPDPEMSVEGIQEVLHQTVGYWPEEWMREVTEDRENRPGNQVSTYGLHDPVGLEERLARQLGEIEDLEETIRRLHDEGQIEGSTEALQALYRLGVLSDQQRLTEAFVIAGRREPAEE